MHAFSPERFGKLRGDQQSASGVKPGAAQRLRSAYRDVVRRERQQGRILRAITETAMDSIFCKNLERRYTFVNPAMARLIGLPADAILGRTPEEIYDSAAAAIVREADDRTLAEGIVDVVRTLILEAKPHTLHSVQVPMRDANDRIFGICGIVRDVTEAHENMLELKRYRHNLEALVEARTAELAQMSEALQQQLASIRRMEGELRLAHTREREQISRDLHDGLGQTLVGLQFKSGALARALQVAHRAEADEAEALSKLAREAIQETKRISEGVRPIVLTLWGLPSALRQLADTTATIFSIRCDCDCADDVMVENPDEANELYLIAKEAVTNAARHSGAALISISARKTADSGIDLVIRDNGRGLRENPDGTGMGLRQMRYRAETIGAQFEVRPHPEGGTEVRCRLRCDQAG